MSLSIKVRSIQLTDKRANDDISNVANAQKSETWSERFWKRIPVGVRNVAWGLAFAAMLSFNTPAFSATPKYPPTTTTVNVKVMDGNTTFTRTMKVKLDSDLKEAYYQYKTGELKKQSMLNTIVRYAARAMREQKIPDEKLAEVVGLYLEELEKWYNNKSRVPAKKKVKTQTKKESKEEKPARIIIIEKCDTAANNDSAKEKPKEPKEPEEKESEKPANKQMPKEPEEKEGNAQQSNIEPVDGKKVGSVDEKKVGPVEEKKEEAAPSPLPISDEAQLSVPADEDDNAALPYFAHSSDDTRPSHAFELVVPITFNSVNLKLPYDAKLVQGNFVTPAVFTRYLSEHLGFSVMTEYQSSQYEFGGVGKRRYILSGGLGLSLKFDELTLSGLVPMTSINDRYAVGVLLLMQSRSLNASASTWFRTDDNIPSQFNLRYWDNKSKYPLILDARASLNACTHDDYGAHYKHSMGDLRLQLPLSYDNPNHFYPNIMVGVVGSNLNADPNVRSFLAGEVGASLTWKVVNVGGGILYGRTHRKSFVPGDGIVEIHGKEYNGSLIKDDDSHIGWTAFMGLKGGRHENSTASLRIEVVSFGQDVIFMPELGLLIRW